MYILSGKTGYLTNILNVMDYSFLERSKYKKISLITLVEK